MLGTLTWGAAKLGTTAASVAPKAKSIGKILAGITAAVGLQQVSSEYIMPNLTGRNARLEKELGEANEFERLKLEQATAEAARLEDQRNEALSFERQTTARTEQARLAQLLHTQSTEGAQVLAGLQGEKNAISESMGGIEESYRQRGLVASKALADAASTGNWTPASPYHFANLDL